LKEESVKGNRENPTLVFSPRGACRYSFSVKENKSIRQASRRLEKDTNAIAK